MQGGRRKEGRDGRVLRREEIARMEERRERECMWKGGRGRKDGGRKEEQGGMGKKQKGRERDEGGGERRRKGGGQEEGGGAREG